ncbi:MAG: helix-turn-helix domain-containing protein [Azospirillum sp.]|nr:helix-turn-helix domain-containing protein [Azospirillum sp.]
MDMRKLVGRNLARIRKAKNLTQEQVEALSGFSQQYLSGLERGRRNPTIVTLFELAQALGVSHVDLVAPDLEIDDPPQPLDEEQPSKKAGRGKGTPPGGGARRGVSGSRSG